MFNKLLFNSNIHILISFSLFCFLFWISYSLILNILFMLISLIVKLFSNILLNNSEYIIGLPPYGIILSCFTILSNSKNNNNSLFKSSNKVSIDSFIIK